MSGPVAEATERCRSCGYDLRAGARFCDACGSPVNRPAPAGEHKQVTVLFADVVGSMKLAAVLDAERLRDIMNDVFNRAAAVVQRYQGTVDAFTGDGLMALFGAPIGLEDHALRACIAALEIQSVAAALSGEVRRRDGVALRLRVGLNSGDVVVGDIGSSPGRYTAVGHSVGMAQRMESAAPEGGVRCSLSTARLVEDVARLTPIETVRIKDSDEPVPTRRLLAVPPGGAIPGRNDGVLLGRDAELGRLQDAFAAGRGGLVGVVGEPGMGKSRLVGAFADSVENQGARVVVARGEAHASVLAFRMLALVLRGLFQVDGRGPAEAREHVLAQFDGHLAAQSPDARILFDAMGIGDGTRTGAGLGGRRRRLVELTARSVRVRTVRTVVVLEDVHWIDTPSDEVLADLVAELDGDAAAVFVATYRPEFCGALRARAPDPVRLLPLADEMALRLLDDLLGEDSSLGGLAGRIADATAGNPYFIEEIVRDLVGRGVLTGRRGRYRMLGGVDRITVPATVQAVLTARIDRLPMRAKSILNAAAVIGARFDAQTLSVLYPDVQSAGLAELVAAELIDQTQFLPRQQYCFHHPLVRTVAYESQLARDRARAHAALAVAIEHGNPAAADENAALIATHFDAAGEHQQAYRWHMRAAQWLRSRDVPAAREQWEHARRIADLLPDEQAGVTDMRVAPRTLLVSTSLYVGNDAQTAQRYREFRDLATGTADTRSLAIGTAGQLWSMVVNAEHIHEAAALASDLQRMAETERWDVEATGIVVNAVAFANFANCEFDAGLRALDLLPVRQTPAVELAPAQALRGLLELCLGRNEEGGRHLSEGVELARADRPMTFAHTVLYAAVAVVLGVCEPDEFLEVFCEAAHAAESLGEGSGIFCARWAQATAALRSAHGSRIEAITALRQGLSYIDEFNAMNFMKPMIVADLAADAVRRGDGETALAELRSVFARYAERGSRVFLGCLGEVLVETLVERGAEDDLAEARQIVERWRSLRPGIPALDRWWLRAQALLDGGPHRRA